MKHKVLIWVLGIEAIACILFFSLRASFGSMFTTVMAFPFEQIGFGLRALSLSSEAGNAAVVAIYVTICLLPVAALAFLWKKRKLYAEDGLLVLLSFVLFAVINIMINPSLIGAYTSGGTGQSFGKAMYGGVVYSVIIGYFILRILRLVSAGGTENLMRYMSIILGLFSMLFLYLIFDALIESIRVLLPGGILNGFLFGLGFFFLIMQIITDTLPYALNIVVIFAALRLLDEMRKDRYSTETVAAVERTSRLCIVALVTTVLSNIIINLVPVLFGTTLLFINVSVQIPVLSIAFVLAALLLTRLVTESKELKDDNDMII